MIKTSLGLMVVLGLLVGEISCHDFFNRWRRQATNCQPGDEACQKCSSNCGAVPSSHLPECCEAYNACCDEYFQACKQCSDVASSDQYFPEYCCASFTSCCDLITTFTVEVKPAAVVRSKPKKELKIPEVAAPKPTSFPGVQPVALTNLDTNTSKQDIFQEDGPIPVFPSQGPPPSPQESIFAPQRPAVFPKDPAFEPRSPDVRPREPAFAKPQPTPSLDEQVSVGGAAAAPTPADNSQRQRTRTQARAQARPPTKERQHNTRRPNKNGLDLASRRGRVTSRGRVSA